MKILFFAQLREQIRGDDGQGVINLTLPTGVHNTAELRDWLVVNKNCAALLSCENLRCAVNQDMASWDSSVSDNDEVAFFPPVTGG